jgi:hypothetical protein
MKPKSNFSVEEKKLKAKAIRLYNNYGITLAEWDEMFKKQEGVCWMCKSMPKNGILCIDHLHQKGFKKMLPEDKKKYVRGLLCFTCNTGFARIERRKNPRQLLERVVEYFKVFPIKGDL